MPARKLIEVALPLDEINVASAREKSIRHGHPSTLHLWWSRKPLATARVVLFASLLDDPDDPNAQPDFVAACQKLTTGAYSRINDTPRNRLFDFIVRLVQWENSTNEEVLSTARKLIRLATNNDPPPVYDPFAGGGSIPLEAQRLGLEAHASDLNPVAVLINKALIEIPPKFANQPPVSPSAQQQFGAQWKGAAGLAVDVRSYGQWMRDEAFKKIGHLYPKVTLPKEQGGGEATVIAWLYCRTVRCPNPACGAMMPLTSKFALSTKKGKETWVEPQIERSPDEPPRIRFTVHSGQGTPPEPTKITSGANPKFRCIACEQVIDGKYVKAEGMAGRIDKQMIAIVAEGRRGRLYLPPLQQHSSIAETAVPTWYPDAPISNDRRSMFTPLYGLTHFHHLFTPRQLVALTTFSDLVQQARKKVYQDALASGGTTEQAQAYADAVATYLALGVSRLSDISNALCRWENTKTQVRNLFARQAIPMIWDFAENNVFAGAAGDYIVSLGSLVKVLENLYSAINTGSAIHKDATHLESLEPLLVSTDPPYYDNIGYADLSDFFYVWLRKSLGSVYPDLFSTLLVPKAPELVATPYRFGGDKKAAERFFEQGLGHAFVRMHDAQHSDYPLTVYYAFKQAESESDDGDDSEAVKKPSHVSTASTGWETMLEGLIQAGFAINGTWPSRTELSNRPVASGTNALASSIVLVCRPRSESVGTISRREFLQALRRELPGRLRDLQASNIAPVDLAQAAIGPGMAVYSRYAQVLEQDGSRLGVRTALQLINQMLDEVLAEQEGDYDAETRWALAWYEQNGTDEDAYGNAETLSKAKNTAVNAMQEAGIIVARAGKVRLLRRDELPTNWNPKTDMRLTVWETVQHLVRAVEQGEDRAAELLADLGAQRDAARELAYRLYTLCERKKWAAEARAYNTLVVAWPALLELASEINERNPVQSSLSL